MPIFVISTGGAANDLDASTSLVTFSHLYSSALHTELGTDDSTTLFTTGRRKNAINEGLEQFSDLTECFTRQSTIASSHGVGEYDLLSTVAIPGGDYSRLSKQRPEFQLLSSGSTQTVIYTSGDNFVRRDVEWLNQYEPGWRSSTGGTPQYFYEREDGGKRFFGMVPPPNIGSSQTGKVIFPYVARAPKMTSDTDVPWRVTGGGGGAGIRSDLHVFLPGPLHYAAAQLEKLRVNTEAEQRHMQQFVSWCQRFLMSRRPKGGTTVKHARNYFSEQKSRSRDDLPRPQPGWNY